jgi:hypothetical protein
VIQPLFGLRQGFPPLDSDHVFPGNSQEFQTVHASNVGRCGRIQNENELLPLERSVCVTGHRVLIETMICDDSNHCQIRESFRKLFRILLLGTAQRQVLVRLVSSSLTFAGPQRSKSIPKHQESWTRAPSVFLCVWFRFLTGCSPTRHNARNQKKRNNGPGRCQRCCRGPSTANHATVMDSTHCDSSCQSEFKRFADWVQS